MIYDDDDMLQELKRLKKQILKASEKYPEEIFLAFCVAMMGDVKQEYLDFVEGLEGLGDKDKGIIIKGMMDKKIENFLVNLEDIVEFSEKLLYEFSKIRKWRAR